jgi:hypothetical protein
MKKKILIGVILLFISVIMFLPIEVENQFGGVENVRVFHLVLFYLVLYPDLLIILSICIIIGIVAIKKSRKKLEK